ncbi:BamA/TamA family outer membrane protein [Massilia sp. H-1]|nr:BamA/TamA family outer membrane protein [Massilia sp. H-1]
MLRADAGALASAQKAGVPGTFLFRAGGDGSVRGYGYQALGVKEGEATVGARYLLTGSAEYQYWFKPPWGAAVFVDAGNAADTISELKPKVGYGIGAPGAARSARSMSMSPTARQSRKSDCTSRLDLLSDDRN